MKMPYVLENLVIDRIDLVDEGANSASFIQLFKRKEMSETMEFTEIISKLQPEHLEVVQAELTKRADETKAATEKCDTLTAELAKAAEDLKVANDDLASTKSELEKLADEKTKLEEAAAKEKLAFDEEETIKAMPEELKVIFTKMRDQKFAAEEELRKAKEASDEAAAIAKSVELKSLPIEQTKLVSMIKKCDAEMLDVLTSISTAIDTAVLGEVGKKVTTNTGSDAWTQIEAKAADIEKRDNITKAKAISLALKENPDLYKEYLKGGTN